MPITGGECALANGPHEPGICNGITIFRNSLVLVLAGGERVEAGDGYGGEPQFVKHPKPMGHHPACAEMQS